MIKKNKKYIILTIAVLFIGSMIIIIKALRNNPQEKVKQVNIPSVNYYYEGLIPGKATQEDVEKVLDKPISQENEGEYIKEEYKNQLSPRNHLAYFKDGKMVFFDEIVRWNKNSNDLKRALGEPKDILYMAQVPGSYIMYIYPDKGVSFVGHPKTTTILDIWYFEPMSFEEFKNTWGKDLYESQLTELDDVPEGYR